MKIRNGFVSNSSSSSFVVAFDRVPKTQLEMQELLFGDDTHYRDPYGDSSYGAAEVAATVFRDVGKPLTRKKVIEALTHGWLGKDGPNMDAFRKSDGSWDWDAYEEARKKYATKKADEFMKKNKGKVFLKFHYGDDYGPYYSALEHGDLFWKLPHIVISNH